MTTVQISTPRFVESFLFACVPCENHFTAFGKRITPLTRKMAYDTTTRDHEIRKESLQNSFDFLIAHSVRPTQSANSSESRDSWLVKSKRHESKESNSDSQSNYDVAHRTNFKLCPRATSKSRRVTNHGNF